MSDFLGFMGIELAMTPGMKTRASFHVGYHFTLRAHFPHAPLRNQSLCVDAWCLLREKFPDAHSAALMPTHVHLICPRGDIDDLKKRWSSFQAFLSRRYGKSVFESPDEPEIIPNVQHLSRQIRYVHLNPCRDRLCGDPLEWEWSTHRDYLGAVADPWPRVDQTLRLLGFSPPREAVRLFHAYVSGDPSVDPRGTSTPYPKIGSLLMDLSSAQRAASLALRIENSSLVSRGRVRTMTIRALNHEFEISNLSLGQHFKVHPTALSRGPELSAQELALGKAIRLILSDPRLLTP